MQGSPVPVEANEMHGLHLDVHLPALVQIIEQLNAGAADPVQSLPVLQAFYAHVAETIQALAADPAAQAVIGEANQVLQYAEEMINNTSKQVQKMQREAAEAGAEGDGQQGPDPEMQVKMQEHQLKMDMARQKAELDMSLKQAKFEQEQSMRDAENVLKMREAE
jgi:ABC-type microcin C transport system permease subunit YejB